ncbi:MAG: hypothetical protein VB078_01920 [Clostridiaceae bacterium]|nr:hypothetical protein [Clostridiaceae bacterium]
MKNRAPLPPGIISLAVIFASLCLIVLSLLTFSSARNELSLAGTYEKNISALMSADFNCRKRICKAIEMFEEGKNSNEIAIETNCLSADNILVFTEPIDENRAVRAELELQPKPVLRSFKTLYTGDWSPDESIEVWTGD